MFQPTHPHGVRRAGWVETRRQATVSTHAPARGATVFLYLFIEFILVSTHAPARGATDRLREDILALRFQPTHPHGVRHHAWCGMSSNNVFQPTHPHGVRHLIFGEKQRTQWFQPTHPHGVRPRSGRILLPFLRFNPRTRTGCDLLDLRFQVLPFEFQPTHPHGVRR